MRVSPRFASFKTELFKSERHGKDRVQEPKGVSERVRLFLYGGMCENERAG
nr:MAG TPA: hypothetical protein [Caudoviricetes sp.]